MYRMTSRNAGQAKTKQGEIKRERKGRECQQFVFLCSPFSPIPRHSPSHEKPQKYGNSTGITKRRTQPKIVVPNMPWNR